ncbi:MAG: aminoacyl-histidine dipeptidase [Bacteroidaceae bacterium]|nr:aminoacyl-histidine dipeptidase [Bacteroidaceae bacterium]
MSEIKNLHPQAIWENFDKLCAVPHPSGHLEKIQQFLLDWAAERGIEAFKDAGENIVMRKPATPGMENRKTVTMQAHMDMVPQKAKDSTHNFETDPIQPYIDGEWVKARGTTLGSDDGMGVATIMAVMEDNELVHGPIEGFITADEETTMYGVTHMEPGTLHGDYLMNLDNETEGEFVIGSAGGINLTAELTYTPEVPQADAGVHIVLQGLKGGHSGLEINEGRANANKLMARVVHKAIADLGAELASWAGGNMRNAIPNNAEVVVAVPADKVGQLQQDVVKWGDVFRAEYEGIEDGIRIDAEPVSAPTERVPFEVQNKLVCAITACHNGVLRFIPGIGDIVETSSNLAIVEIGGGKAFFKDLIRSSMRSQREYVEEILTACFRLAGMDVETGGAYTEWQPALKNEMVDLMRTVYKDMYDEEAKVQVVHAGLECSIIGAMYPHMDIVSFGPTLRSPHTPNERCLIATVGKYYDFVKEVLKRVPEK